MSKYTLHFRGENGFKTTFAQCFGKLESAFSKSTQKIGFLEPFAIRFNEGFLDDLRVYIRGYIGTQTKGQSYVSISNTLKHAFSLAF